MTDEELMRELDEALEKDIDKPKFDYFDTIMPCVYGIFHNVKRNGLIDVYIGSSKTYHKRMKGHKRKDNPCSSKQIIERNNYTMDVLEYGGRWNDLTLRIKEQQYMDKYTRDKKYCLVNINYAVKIPRPPPTREQIESTRISAEKYSRFMIWKAWLLSWNEYNIPLCRWGEEPLCDDNMVWIDYDVFS